MSTIAPEPPTQGSRAAAELHATHDHDRGGRHWESWGLRLLMAGILGYHLLAGSPNSAIVAGEGLLVLMIPPAISHFSRWHVPRMLELVFVVSMFLQFASESFKLFELFTYWDKLTHPAEIFFATIVATFLLLGYRELHSLNIPDGLSAAGAMLFGMTLGASWELFEFALDWFGNANLQKSNADTLTDVLTNDAGAIFGALAGFWWYRHRMRDHQRAELGELAEWLTGRLVVLFSRHGPLVGIAVAVLLVGLVAAGWLVDRGPIPPAPSGQGQPATWTMNDGRWATGDVPSSIVHRPPSAAGTGGPIMILRGDWIFDQRGACRVNPERPQPGSEQMGLLALAPDASYGAAGGFTFAASLLAERPPIGQGTAMEIGLAFGVRGPDDFYLLKLSALHDVLTLERYLHGRKRDLREERLRTRGGDWHELRLDLHGDGITAYADGRRLFEEAGLVETVGGLGLWARTSTAGCFGEARVDLL